MIIFRTFLEFEKKNKTIIDRIFLTCDLIYVRAVALNPWHNGGLVLKIDLILLILKILVIHYIFI